MGVVRLMTRLRIKPQITEHARALRDDMPDAERRLWGAVRGKQLYGCRFRRQHPIGKYIADFACIDKKLVIELDGWQHQEQTAYDANRTVFLQAQGWQVLRFWNNDVLNNLDGVLAHIADVLAYCPHPSLPPARGKEHQA